MSSEKIDLHLHSYFSDGELSPAELVEKCRHAGLEVIALTDHECIDGLPEFFTAGQDLHIETPAGAEISAEYEGVEQHLLAINFDPTNQSFAAFLKKCQSYKTAQIREIINKLNALGFNISFLRVLEAAKGIPGIRHIAKIIFDDPDNTAVLRQFRASTHGTFRQLFLPGGQAFIERDFPSIEETLTAIGMANGISAWAHPLWKEQTPQDIFDKSATFKEMGLKGIEVFYPMHDEETTKTLRQIARRLQLAETAGSDFHSPNYEKHSKVFAWQTYGLVPDFSFLWGQKVDN